MVKTAISTRLNADEERALADRWRATGDRDALHRLVRSQMGLVIHMAVAYRHSGPAMEDIVQEGFIGLTVAARRFDPSRGARLSTFASFWVRAYMINFVVRSHGPVRIGTTRGQRKVFFGLGRARRLLESGSEAASTESIAAALGVDPAEVTAMVPRLSVRDVALDASRSDSDGRPSSAFLACDLPSPEESMTEAEEARARHEVLARGLATLDERERAIVRARHLAPMGATLSTLGKKFGVSRERVRQIEEHALSKLRKRCGQK